MIPPAKPPLDATEVRDQFNALKALIDAKTSMDDVNAAITANSSANSNSVETTPTYASNPPTQSEVQSVIYKLNELEAAELVRIVAVV